jgi:hypothetical protein
VSLVDPDFEADGQGSAAIITAISQKLCLSPDIGSAVARRDGGFSHNATVL